MNKFNLIMQYESSKVSICFHAETALLCFSWNLLLYDDSLHNFSTVLYFIVTGLLNSDFVVTFSLYYLLSFVVTFLFYYLLSFSLFRPSATDCHNPEFDQWMKTRSAHRFDRLEEQREIRREGERETNRIT